MIHLSLNSVMLKGIKFLNSAIQKQSEQNIKNLLCFIFLALIWLIAAHNKERKQSQTWPWGTQGDPGFYILDNICLGNTRFRRPMFWSSMAQNMSFELVNTSFGQVWHKTQVLNMFPANSVGGIFQKK